MLLHSVRDIFWKEKGIVLFQEQLSNFSGAEKMEYKASQTESGELHREEQAAQAEIGELWERQERHSEPSLQGDGCKHFSQDVRWIVKTVTKLKVTENGGLKDQIIGKQWVIGEKSEKG